MALPQKSEIASWIESVPQRGSVGSDVVVQILKDFHMRQIDPTLPRCGTDPIQGRLMTFEAKHQGDSR